MKKINIRKSRMIDSESLETAFKKAIREDFTYYPNDAKKEFLKIWNAKFFRKRKPVTFIALKGKKIVGFIISNPGWQKSGVAGIDWLWVEKNNRKLGIASDLINSVEDFMKEMDHHKIVLNADNKLTQNFYKKVGYVIEGEMNDHYWHLNEKIYAKRIIR